MKTLYDKIWEQHLVHTEANKPALLYVDLHLIHEVTTPQAFDSLKQRNLKVRRPNLTFGTLDHSIPTQNIFAEIKDKIAREQIETFRRNCREFGIKFFDIGAENQGIVHVFAPEIGLSQPGMTIVFGDSHTSTHGAFGALAFGIGTSEVEQVLATQCLWQMKSKNLLIKTRGKLGFGVTAKDFILYIIGKIGTDGANGFVVEYAGETVENFTMEQRMTVCNMSIEAGACAGLIAPDATTFNYLKEKKYAPHGEDWEKSVAYWRTLPTDAGAKFDETIEVFADEIEPYVSWGTTPAIIAPVGGRIPDLSDAKDENQLQSWRHALEYMDLQPSQKIEEIEINRAFIGSCTNSRIEDLRAAARIVKGYTIKNGVSAIVVPGSQAVKKQAEKIAAEMLGAEIAGNVCEAVLIDEKAEIEREFYLGFIIDTDLKRPTLLFSDAGGSGIEERGATLKKLVCSIRNEPTIEEIKEICIDEQIAEILQKLYRVAKSCEARTAEINPLAFTKNGELVALDARISVDDYAVFRHEDLEIEIARELGHAPTKLERIAWEIEREDFRGTFYFVEILNSYQLAVSSYHSKRSNQQKTDNCSLVTDNCLIGFHGAGGGGSMASLDAAQRNGLEPACYVDTSGNPPASKVYRAARIILSIPNIRGYFLSGSGVASQEQFVLARGVIKAFREVRPTIPAVLRRAFRCSR